MRQIAAGLLSACAVLCVATVLSAHEVTYKGTVVALQTTKYAQPNGGVREVQELEVTVIDVKTKKPTQKVFTITAKTRVFRDSKRVSVAEAAVEKAERVAVVVDHDQPGDEAIEVRLQGRK